MKNLSYIFFILIILSIISCEKEFKMNVKEDTNMIVVDGKIENDFPPYILLTRSFSIYKGFNINSILNMFVNGAQISITNNNDTIRLKEYNSSNLHEIPDSFKVEFARNFGFDTSNFNGSLPPFISFYTIDFSADSIYKGKLGETYDLKIEVEGKTLTSTTTIPNRTVMFDSLWLETHPNPTKYPNYCQLTGILADNASTTDYYRYSTKTKNSPWLISSTSVFDDGFFNGKKFKIFIPKGHKYGDQPDPLDQTEGYWNFSDSTLIFKLSLIDKPHYDFWRTLESNRDSQGNPFGTFVVIKSNIKGGTGVWGGYASYTHYFNLF